MQAVCCETDARVLTKRVIEALYAAGVRELCLCPGGRNASFVQALANEERVRCYFWPEERSAAFFALGRARGSERPVAVVVTSGTAAGELLPAAMEARYSGAPLLLVTADRPRRQRRSGAPQAALQEGLFGPYAATLDLEGEEKVDLKDWGGDGPLHLNVCLEEYYCREEPLPLELIEKERQKSALSASPELLEGFLEEAERPVAIVGTLPPEERMGAARFLEAAGMPVYLEGPSGLRGAPGLEKQRICHSESVHDEDYDAVLRVGGVPTLRLWRDLEKMEGKKRLFSVSSLPYPGVSWGAVAPIDLFAAEPKRFSCDRYSALFARDKERRSRFQTLISEEPHSEPALVAKLSRLIPQEALLYIGNSLPVREWDMAAAGRHPQTFASRGLNGIDGQLSAFFGLCQKKGENWAVVGDLTALYDMAAPWILPQLECGALRLVVINNSGGKLFSRLMKEPVHQNSHSLNFRPLAEMWGLCYQKWEEIPEAPPPAPSLIELLPDNSASERFWSAWRG